MVLGFPQPLTFGGCSMEPQRMPGTARVLSVRQNDLTARARAAADVAKTYASAVDAEARFPSEAFAEIRKQRLLGIQVPQALGGEGASIAEMADVCYILGQSCSSAALIYAMHQIKMACITRHAKGSAGHRAHFAPNRGRTIAHGILHHRRPGRRQRALQRGGRRARRRASDPRTQGHRHFLRRRGGRHRHHGTPRGRCARVPTRCCWSC